MRISARRVAIDVLKSLLFVLALLYLADYFRWSLFTEAGGATRASAIVPFCPDCASLSPKKPLKNQAPWAPPLVRDLT